MMDVTGFLAVWGAILSTIALGWNVLRDSRDRGRLKIDAMIGKMHPDHTDRDYLVITVTNVGKRPLLVKGWGGMKRKGASEPRGILIVPRGLPRMLKESEYHIEWTPDLTVLDEDTERIYAWDSSGKEWALTRKQMKRLRQERSELGKSPQS
jgi:hypothetical protein